MKKRIITTTLIVAFAHLLLATVSTLLFIRSVYAWDNPLSGIEFFFLLLVFVLNLPGILLWTTWMSQNMPNAIENTLFVANSLLWGFVIALIINAPALMKKKKSDNDAATTEDPIRAKIIPPRS